MDFSVSGDLAGNTLVEWSAGTNSRQVLEASDSLGPSADWQEILTLEAPTPTSSQELVPVDRPQRFFRIRFERD